MSSDKFPVSSFFFDVSIGGVYLSFQEVSGLDMTIEYESSDDNEEEKKPTKRKFGNITLKRGYFQDGTYKSAIFDWFNSNFNPDEGSKIEPKPLDIYMMDPYGYDVMHWHAPNCYPVKWGFSALNASKSDISLESIELSVDRLEFRYG